MSETPTKKRFLFIDNLRWLLISLVVLIHINVTYGQVGSWYYVEERPLDAASGVLFSMYGSFAQAFLLGLLFFIAGYFAYGSLARKGTGGFLKERALRLGVPTLIYMLLIYPIISVFLLHSNPPEISVARAYLRYLTSLEFVGQTGPMWFTLALLVFCLIYAALKAVLPRRQPVEAEPAGPTQLQIVGTFLLIGVVAFLVRLVQPIGTAILNMQLCFFTQYVVLFCAGLVFARRNWLTRIPYRTGLFWLKAAILIGVPLWFVIAIGGGAPASLDAFGGGPHWQALAYALWESFFSVAFGLGLLVVFREKFDAQGPVTRFLADNAFGVYLFHAPILIYISLLLKGLAIYPLLKAVLVAAVTLPACFGFSYVVRRVPFLTRLLK